MRGDKTAGRQLLIRKLLQQKQPNNQEALARQLAEAGFQVTQATVSRDLASLGAIKLKNDQGQEYYAIPKRPPNTPPPALSRLMQQFVVGIESSGNLAVLMTPPGGSSPIAAAIDNAKLDDVLATVAGDDTILVVARRADGGAALARELKSIMGVQS